MRPGWSTTATPEKAMKLDAIPPTVGRRRVDARRRRRSSLPLPRRKTHLPATRTVRSAARAAAVQSHAGYRAGFAGQISAAALFFPARCREYGCTRPASEPAPPWCASLSMANRPTARSIWDAAVITGIQYQPQTDRLGVAGRERRRKPSETVLRAPPWRAACTALPTPDLAPANLRSVEPRTGALEERRPDHRGPAVSALRQPATAKVPLIVDVHGGPSAPGKTATTLCRVPGGPRLGRPAPQPARVVQLRSQICRGQQE